MKTRPSIDCRKDAKARLLKAALKLFAQKGYAATSVRQILEESGTTAPCLYYHFGNKEGLYLELARVHFSKIDSLMEYYVSSSADSRRKLKELIDRTFCQVRKNSKFVRILNATYFGPPRGAPSFDFQSYLDRFHRLIVRILAEGIKKGEFRLGNPDDMAFVIRGVLRLAIEDQIVQGGTRINQKRLQKMMDLILDGFERMPGRQSPK